MCHRLNEIASDYVEKIESTGLKFVGKDESGERMEVCELLRGVHPFVARCDPTKQLSKKTK